MPAKYDAIKKKLMSKGYKEEDAEGHAARIYNASRPSGATPVTRNYDKTKAKAELD